MTNKSYTTHPEDSVPLEGGCLAILPLFVPAYLSSNTSIDIESTTRNQTIDLPSTSSTVVNEGWDTPMQQIQEDEVMMDSTEREESIEVLIHLENDDEQRKNIDVVATSHLIHNRPPIAALSQCDFDDARTAQRTQSSRHLIHE
jgi:hypothetical protein